MRNEKVQWKTILIKFKYKKGLFGFNVCWCPWKILDWELNERDWRQKGRKRQFHFISQYFLCFLPKWFSTRNKLYYILSLLRLFDNIFLWHQKERKSPHIIIIIISLLLVVIFVEKHRGFYCFTFLCLKHQISL